MLSSLPRTSTSSVDPLAALLAPPTDEAPTARAARLRAEHDARRVSDAIDDDIARQRAAAKRLPRPVKILLLGQSESGKSTTLKNFQLWNEPKAFRAERASWRAVIHLNVVRSVRLILDLLAAPPTGADGDAPADAPPPVAPALRARLAPLAHAEAALLQRLLPASPHSASAAAPAAYTGLPAHALAALAHAEDRVAAGARAEPALPAGAGWAAALAGRRARRAADALEDDTGDADAEEEEALAALAPAMRALWADARVRGALAARGVRMEETAGFFLDELDRVTARGYVPTDDDILRARIKTLGVSEHRFRVAQKSTDVSDDFRIYDVGGQRSLRAAWVPYFDDVDLVIFLAPISAFDQVLAEDPSVNRLEDSVLLYKSVASNALLARTNIVLFLNKCDMLRAKLRAGVRMAEFVLSYGGRANDFASASGYLKKKFSAIHRQHSPSPRSFYCHFTSVTNTESTRLVLQDVHDIAVRQSLKDVALLP